jgi:hypothetical protein
VNYRSVLVREVSRREVELYRDPRRHGVLGDTVGQERLTDQSVALIIKSRARAAHLPAELLPKLSGARR